MHSSGCSRHIVSLFKRNYTAYVNCYVITYLSESNNRKRIEMSALINICSAKLGPAAKLVRLIDR